MISKLLCRKATIPRSDENVSTKKQKDPRSYQFLSEVGRVFLRFAQGITCHLKRFFRLSTLINKKVIRNLI